jgi:Protein of unknown function (DUF4231)
MCKSSNFWDHDREDYDNAMTAVGLSDMYKTLFMFRFVRIVENFKNRARFYSRMFTWGHFLVTVGSLFVPALLSIQNSNSNITMGNSNFSGQIYWSTFTISLLVTICNGILNLFKIDKKYYFLHTTLERLRSEGWQYLGLTGRYSGHLTPGIIPTHENQFIYFLNQVEKIKMRQVEEEYYKMDEKNSQEQQQRQGPNQNSTAIDLYPKSPQRPVNLVQEEIPNEVSEAVNTIIRSQKTTSMNNPVFEPPPSPTDPKLVDSKSANANMTEV